MLRLLISLVAAAGMTACASPRQETPPPGAMPADSCQADAVQDAVGRPITSALADELRLRSGSQALRLLKPGQVVTMEFNARRLSVSVNRSDVVTALRCG